MLINEAFHQGLKMYSSLPSFLKFYINGEFFGRQLQRATSLSCELFCERSVLSSTRLKARYIGVACGLTATLGRTMMMQVGSLLFAVSHIKSAKLVGEDLIHSAPAQSFE